MGIGFYMLKSSYQIFIDRKRIYINHIEEKQLGAVIFFLEKTNLYVVKRNLFIKYYKS